MILFKRKFQEAIRSGAKTQTIRFWRQALARPGELHKVPGVGYLRIREVAEVSVEALTEADARADGFESLAALKEELGRLYGGALRDGRRCFRIAFEFVGKEKPV